MRHGTLLSLAQAESGMEAQRGGGGGGEEEEQEEQEEKEQKEELSTVRLPHAGRTAECNGKRREEGTVVSVVCKEARSPENTAKNNQESRAMEHRKAKMRGDDKAEEEERTHGAIRHGKRLSDSLPPARSRLQKQSWSPTSSTSGSRTPKGEGS